LSFLLLLNSLRREIFVLFVCDISPLTKAVAGIIIDVYSRHPTGGEESLFVLIEELKMCHVKICQICVLIISSWNHLRNCNFRKPFACISLHALSHKHSTGKDILYIPTYGRP
jgi:hypothetical protein